MTENTQLTNEPKTFDGLNAYRVITKVGNEYLPYGLRLPFARSMTQAKIDYDFRKEAIVEWYNKTHKPCQ
jgi:hypothetical protein